MNDSKVIIFFGDYIIIFLEIRQENANIFSDMPPMFNVFIFA